MRILFVCTGNICRSPLAEGILRKKATEAGLEIEVDSCGFERFHAGDAPDPRARKVASENGIDISWHRARVFTDQDFDRFDKIYVMDEGHYRNVSHHARTILDLKKVDYTMNALYPGSNIPVEDPWYDSMEAFYNVYDQIDKACQAITDQLCRSRE